MSSEQKKLGAKGQAMQAAPVTRRIVLTDWEAALLLPDLHAFRRVQRAETVQEKKPKAPRKAGEKPKPADMEVVKKAEVQVAKDAPKAEADREKAPKKEKKMKIHRPEAQYAIWNPEIPFKETDNINDIRRLVGDYLRWAFSAYMKKPFSVRVDYHVGKTGFSFAKDNFEKKQGSAKKRGKAAHGAAKKMYAFVLHLDRGQYTFESRTQSMKLLLKEIDSLITRHEKSVE
ncbi:MAG: hypothetical protein NTX79_08295 [Candidatus Micrarchaeota archaeon]|nr:hypothetical protein [Candidatus Micrarchaeota archaeon]